MYQNRPRPYGLSTSCADKVLLIDPDCLVQYVCCVWLIECESHARSVGVDWYRLYPIISIRIDQYLLLFTIEVLAGTEEINCIIEKERVICELWAKAEETVEHSTYKKAQSDGSSPVAKINALFAWRIKKVWTKEVVEWRMCITATRQKTITWLVVILKRCQGRTYKRLWSIWSQHPCIRLEEPGKTSRDLRTAGNPHEIWWVYQPNESLQGYHYMGIIKCGNTKFVTASSVADLPDMHLPLLYVHLCVYVLINFIEVYK